jgi:hypothetical protein
VVAGSNPAGRAIYQSVERAVVTSHPLIFPEDFDEYASEVESKGRFSGVRLNFEGRDYALTFYDPVRLGQEIEAEFQREGIFFEPSWVLAQSPA